MNGGDYPHHQIKPTVGQIPDDPEIRALMSLGSALSHSPSSSNSPQNVPAAASGAAGAVAAAAPPASTVPVHLIPGMKNEFNFFHHLYEDLPIISSPLKLTCKIYNCVRRSNCITYGMLKTVEETVRNCTNPIMDNYRSDLLKIDIFLDNMLTCVENNVPVIKSTPAEMYANTKWMIKYVCTGHCTFDCVCLTGMAGLNIADKMIDLVRCKPCEDRAVRNVPRRT